MYKQSFYIEEELKQEVFLTPEMFSYSGKLLILDNSQIIKGHTHLISGSSIIGFDMNNSQVDILARDVNCDINYDTGEYSLKFHDKIMLNLPFYISYKIKKFITLIEKIETLFSQDRFKVKNDNQNKIFSFLIKELINLY